MNCLIKQPHCGLEAGQTECPKCGMRSDVSYVSKEDMDTALATAKATWEISEMREAAKRVNVKPGNAVETPALPDKKAPVTAKLKTEQTVSGQELSRSNPSQSMTWVVVALLVLGGGSYVYVQHQDSQAQLVAPSAARAPSAAPVTTVPDIPSPQDNLIKVTRKFNDPVAPDQLKQIQQKKYVAPYFYTVLDELIVAYPELIDLIFETKLMDSKTKQYWFDILPAMTDQQMSNLFEMLKTNRAPEMPTPPSTPTATSTSTSSSPLGSNSAIEKAIVDFNLQNCKRDVFTKLDADWNKDVRSMRFVYLSLSNCNQPSENGGRVLIIPKDESCSAVSYPSPELANIIGYAPMGKGIMAFTLELGGNKMKQTIYWKSPSISNPYNCAGSMSFYSR